MDLIKIVTPKRGRGTRREEKSDSGNEDGVIGDDGGDDNAIECTTSHSFTCSHHAYTSSTSRMRTLGTTQGQKREEQPEAQQAELELRRKRAKC